MITVVAISLAAAALSLTVHYLMSVQPIMPWRDERELMFLSAAVAGLLVAAIGAGLGLFLTDMVRRPVDRMVDGIKTTGAVAIEGTPGTVVEAPDDPMLPDEFREVANVCENLLRQSGVRQSTLEEAARSAERARESLSAIVSESREAKIVMEDGRIIVANPAAAVAFGHPESPMIGRTLAQVLEGSTLTDATGEQLDAESLLRAATLEASPVQLSSRGQTRWHIAQAVRHSADSHERILFTARDVTEEHRLHDVRSEMLSLITHDLRSPLSVVVGYLDLLRQPLGDDDRERALDSAKRSTERMTVLLEDLLSAMRADELLAPTALAPVSVADLAEDVVSVTGPAYPDRQLLLEIDSRPIVSGEERRLRQVLVNLLVNALKYSPDGDPVLMRVACVDSRAIVQVSDRGPGVPPEDRERVFDRFTRLEGTAAGRPGFGLGLYIVRIISENHGGTVRVDENPGGGATFTVELPCSTPACDDPTDRGSA